MAQAQQGDRVTIEYTGTLDDGSIFDSTLEGDECDSEECDSEECESGECDDEGCGCGGHESGPMQLTIGAADFFPQIEEALVGMAPGEKKTIVIPVDDAFGDYDEEKVFTVARKDLPEDLDPEIGDQLGLSDENDETIGVTVMEVTEESITFDANHPLAGENLTFEFQLVEILPPE
jgi:peptidylprolyl isomerase